MSAGAARTVMILEGVEEGQKERLGEVGREEVVKVTCREDRLPVRVSTTCDDGE